MNRPLLPAATHEALRERDGVAVWSKSYAIDDPLIIAAVERELEPVRELSITGVLRPIELERADGQLTILHERCDGVALEQLAGEHGLSGEQLLPIAIALTETLAAIHGRGLLHGDLRPSTLFHDAEHERAYLGPFGLPTLIDHERRALIEAGELEAVLPYLAPELRNRHRPRFDARSDLYSFGACLYRLLSGRPPFVADSVQGYRLAKLTRVPRALAGVSPWLAAIVAKLLAKAPRQRYQSAAGLLVDLRRCAELLANGTLDAEVELGSEDRPASLMRSSELYGREPQLRLLMRELALAHESACSRVVVVHGPAGVGKTALLEGFDEAVAGRDGLLGLGRFEAGGAAQAGLFVALDGVFEQLADHAVDAREQVCERVHERVGSIAAVLAERLPSFARVCGLPAAVDKLEPHAERRRFELALSRLLDALGERAPLVLALDNCELAGPDDLALLRAVVRANPPVLLLLGCASAALQPEHRLATWLTELEQAGVGIERMGIEPLRRSELAEWIDELFGAKSSELGWLGAFIELLERRTERIPGQVRSCVEQLVDHKLLEPSPAGWSWDSLGIDRTVLAIDGAARLDDASTQLSEAELELLDHAAALGERFSARVLARALPSDASELIAALDRLTKVGLLVRIGLDYRFAWSVHEAVLERASPKQRRRVQLAAALAIDQGPCSDAAVAAAVLRAGGAEALRELPATQRAGLLDRCAAAGRLAIATGAWTIAHEYLGLALHANERGADDIELCCDHALALALGPEPERAESAFEQLLDRPLSLEAHVQVVVRKARCATARGRWDEALDIGAALLARCGVHFRSQPSVAALLLALARAYLACRSLDRDSLQPPGPLAPELAAELLVIDAIADAAYFANPRAWVLLVAMRAQRIARVGLHASAPQAIAHLAVSLATILRRAEQAGRLCDLAVELCERIEGAGAQRARVESSGLLVVWPMTRPLSACVDGLIECQQYAFEAGDVGVARQIATGGLGVCFHAGVSLPQLHSLGASWRAQLERWSSADTLAAVDGWLEFLAALIEPRREPTSLVAESELAAAGVGAALRDALALNGALALWLLGEREAAAVRLEPLLDTLERTMFGSWQIPPGAVMLAMVANHRVDQEKLEPRVASQRIRFALRLARRFASLSWANFGVHVELITGELERQRGRIDRALLAYERARSLAVDTDNVCMQALACDRLANLALAHGRRVTARGAAVTGVATLRRWGAEAAARQLELEYADLLAVVVPSARTPMHLARTTPDGHGRQRTSLDAARVLEVMDRISEELRFEEVVARVIGSAIRGEGERAVLLLDHEGVIGVVAHGDGREIDEFVAQPIPLAEAGELVPRSVVEHTLDSGAVLVIDDASTDLRFAGDPYLQQHELGSLLCMPVSRQADRVGVLVVENRVASGAFPPERVEVLRVLLARAASALSHARLYEALQRSEVLFRSLVDGVPDMISLMDRSGRVEFINHAGDFSVDPNILIGVDSTLLLDPSCGPQWRAAIEQVSTTGEPQALEIRASFPGGLTRWYAIRLNALEFGGKIGKLISIATDISARKLAEADKLRLEAQLRQQQRLESVGTLASGVAHEINNPIQGIMNYADLILARAHDKELVIDFTAEILTESERIATIVRNLLAFSRQEAAEQTPELCSVQCLIDATLSLIRAVVRKDDIELRIDLPDELHDIRCRQQQIQQIIMNLVANARDALNDRYADGGGRKLIEIRARNFERGGRDWVRISVEDGGTGIPEHVRARIFDPFFTTKGRDQGTGLGLAVSHGIAVEHGGELWVESEPGVGSTFHLDLPAFAEPDALVR